MNWNTQNEFLFFDISPFYISSIFQSTDQNMK